MIYISTGLLKEKTSHVAKIFLKNNFKNIELSSGKFEKKINIKLKNLKKKFNCNLAVHNYFPPPKKSFVFNLASLNNKITKLSINHAKKSIKLAKELGGKYYSFHAGFLVDPKIKNLGKKINITKLYPKGIAIEKFIKRVNVLSNFAKKLDIQILIENNVITKENLNIFKSNPLLMSDVKDTLYIMKKTNNNVNLLIDVGHLNVSSKTLGFKRDKYIKKTKKWIKAFHLSDNNRLEDQNNKISKKSWFWKHLNKKLEYYSLEIKSKNIKLLKNQINIAINKIEK